MVSSAEVQTTSPAWASNSRRPAKAACCAAMSSRAAGVDRVQLLRRRQAVGRALQHARALLADEAGDAHGVEFIEVGGADGDEAQPLQQRVAGIARLPHHAEVEIQPGQFAVNETGWIIQAEMRNFR